MPRLTVVLTAYKRIPQLIELAAALREQSEPIQLWLWDNSDHGTRASAWDRFDRVVWAPYNAGCSARWWLAAQADTPLVIVMDDDLVPTDEEVLFDTCEWLEDHPLRAAGLVGVRLDPRKPYRRCGSIGHTKHRRYLACDTEVDIIKGRYLAVERERLEGLPMRLPRYEDDIAVSACLGGGVILAGLQGRFLDFPTGCEAVSSRPCHAEARETARREWFRD